tara:strand:+ start:2330 stop:3046 length:717 start_codon:yes stop_codon:yes gene_type:complete
MVTDYKNQIKIFYDGTNIDLYGTNDFVKGFTTNPTLLNNGNIDNKNYKDFAINMLKKTNNLPVSFEVFADDIENMIIQAREIYSWNENIYVKIPIINTKGESMASVIETLNSENIKLNITAVFTEEQINTAFDSIKNKNIHTIISVFSGRIADAGFDAKKIVKYATEVVKDCPNIEILWASVREVYNIFDAIDVNCHIVTVPDSIFKKLDNIGKDLTEFSKETVNMFYNDGLKSGIIL